MRIAIYLGLLDRAEQSLATSLRQVGEDHRDEPDVASLCRLLAKQCDDHRDALRPVLERYGQRHSHDEPERLHAEPLDETRTGPLGLLRDLADLFTLASFVDINWTVVEQAAQALRDRQLIDVVAQCEAETATQVAWLRTRLKQSAPQALVVGAT